MSNVDRGWCDECGHEVGASRGARLSYNVDGRVLCGECYSELNGGEGQ